MENRVLIREISKYHSQKVVLNGWLANKRSSGKILFLQLRDGSGDIQVIFVKTEKNQKTFDELKHLPLESALSFEGRVKKEPRAPSGFEIELEDAKVISRSADDYPIGKKKHGVAFLMDNRHLWLRSRRQRAILEIRYQTIQAINQFYKDNNFHRVDTPIFTPNACEGTTTLFEVDYFGDKAFLSQSGQLYLEAAIFAFGRAYDFSPVFRAEKSKTRRHLTEFWMTNAEAAFVEHEENLKIQEQLILFILESVLKNCQQQFEILKRDIEPLAKIKAPFLKMTYKQALKQLKDLGSDIKPGEDLGNDDETLLMTRFKKPLFIEMWPANIKAFYMKRSAKDPSLAICADLLAPEGYGELIGGSQREDDYQLLLESIKKHKLPQDAFQWYLDLRKYGSVPHSGFGLGLERLIAWLCGLKHVRETIPFPRMLYHLKP